MEFEKAADELFDKIIKIIESCDLVEDVEFTDSVIEFSLCDADFIINKRRCSKEIWLSSQKTGPHHFKLSDNGWINERGLEILKLLISSLDSH